MASKSKLLVRGSTLRVLNLFANIAVTFFMLPFLIDHLGQRFYGMWTLIGSVIAYLGYMDFGLSKAAQVFVGRALGRKSADEANRVLSTTVLLFSIVGIIVFSLAVCIAWLGPVFLEDESEVSIFATAVVILGVNAGIAFPVMAFNGFFSANLRYDIVVLIGLSRLLVRSAFIVYVVNAGYSLVGMAVVATLVDLAGHVAKLIILRRIYRDVAVSTKLFDRSLIPSLYSYGGKASVHSVADLLRFKIDLLIIGAWLGLSAVAVYGIASRLAQYLRQLLGTVFGVTIPLYAQFDAAEDFDQARQLLTFSLKLAAVSSVLLAGNAIVFGSYFVEIWLGPDFSQAYAVLSILIIGSAIHVSQEPSLALLYGYGEHGRYAAVAVVEGLVNVGLSVWLIHVYGLYGVAAGTTLAVLLTAGFALWSVSDKFNLAALDHAKMYAKVLTVGSGLHMLAILAVSQIRPGDFLSLFSIAFVIAAFEAIVMWFLMFTQNERQRIIDLAFERRRVRRV